ncbi:MAG: hypothetical protein SGJ17_12380 [Hyphomicrobiales bacterium]|nr:hypothetical protein [Hyphomicrobiales bacterium]
MLTGQIQKPKSVRDFLLSQGGDSKFRKISCAAENVKTPFNLRKLRGDTAARKLRLPLPHGFAD